MNLIDIMNPRHYNATYFVYDPESIRTDIGRGGMAQVIRKGQAANYAQIRRRRIRDRILP